MPERMGEFEGDFAIKTGKKSQAMDLSQVN